jgi:hypothetical protein
VAHDEWVIVGGTGAQRALWAAISACTVQILRRRLSFARKSWQCNVKISCSLQPLQTAAAHGWHRGSRQVANRSLITGKYLVMRGMACFVWLVAACQFLKRLPFVLAR